MYCRSSNIEGEVIVPLNRMIVRFFCGRIGQSSYFVNGAVLATRKRAKRTYDAEGTRQRILAVAADHFQSHGYHATSMHDIMDAAHVPGGSVYYHFPTKKSLGLAVIREAVHQSIEETWITPIRQAPCAKDGVSAVFDAVATQIERDGRGVTGCPLNNLAIELSLVDPEFQAALRGVFDAWTKALAECIQRDVDTNKLSGVDSAEAATAIVAGFSGAMALAKARQVSEPIRVCARAIARLLAPAA